MVSTPGHGKTPPHIHPTAASTHSRILQSSVRSYAHSHSQSVSLKLNHPKQKESMLIPDRVAQRITITNIAKRVIDRIFTFPSHKDVLLGDLSLESSVFRSFGDVLFVHAPESLQPPPMIQIRFLLCCPFPCPQCIIVKVDNLYSIIGRGSK